MSLEELWNNLENATDCKSLLKKYLTREIYEKLKDTKTKYGGTLKECIQSGCENLSSSVGIYACDPEAYDLFSDVMHPVLEDYHKVKELKHPATNFGDVSKLDFGDLDPSGKYIVSTRVRVGRTHQGFGFPPTCTKQHHLDMEKKTVEALKTLTGELAGTYYPLVDMTEETQKQLTEDHFLFSDSDKCLKSAGCYNDWPIGRGIFFNKDKNFLVWVNEEDHLKIISIQKGGDLAEVYKRLVNAIETLEKKLTFERHDKLGYLTFCPTNVGTTLKASVMVKVPNLSAQPDFKEICEKFNLQPRVVDGELTESGGGVYEVSHKRRLGLSEIEAIQEMRLGIEEIISQEKSLEK